MIKKVFGRKTSKAQAVVMDAFEKFSPGAPTLAVAAPGECQFTPEFKGVALKNKLQISKDTYVFTFATPDETKPLNLSTCACILARMKNGAGEDIIRPYTPCSTNAKVGEFQLMVKVYPDGNMTRHMVSMNVGDVLEFKHIEFNVKIQYPFNKKFIGMLVGGTGITPMIQALHAILGNKEDKTEVGLLFGNRSSDNILAKDVLDEWEASNERLSVTNVVSHEPEDSSWDGLRGFITKELIEKSFPTPEEDILIFVCGPPPMYNVFCGPREDKDNITGILGDMGYSKDQVYKF